MRRKGLVLVVMLGVVLLVTSITEAFQNEPEGFRGVKWGDPPGEDMFSTDWVSKIRGFYKRVNENWEIGGAKLEKIEYHFHKGQFMEVNIKTQRNNHEPLEDVVKLKFGPGYSQENYSAEDEWGFPYEDWLYRWFGDIATVTLKIRIWRYVSYGYLTIRSTKIYNQYQEDMCREEEEEEARRKEEERQKTPEEGLADF